MNYWVDLWDAHLHETVGVDAGECPHFWTTHR